MKNQKKQVDTREIRNGIEMVLKGHDHNGNEMWKTTEENDRPKSAERNKANTYYCISTPAGMLLNKQKTDFNVAKVFAAKFTDLSEAKKWIDENNHKFKSAATGKPLKLTINKYVS